MAWQRMPMETWQNKMAALVEALPDAALADLLSQIELVSPVLEPDDVSAARHPGDVTIAGDYTPLTLLTLIEGDLSVAGQVSTQEVDGNDGHAALVVFGSLRCGSLLNDWGSRVVVTGDLVVGDWLYTAREDSVLVVGGDLRAPVLVSGDSAVEVGGTGEIEHGLGMVRRLGAAGGAAVTPRHGWHALAALLALDPARATEEEEIVPLLEDRLYRIGSILP
ncbi:hypothetical protein KZ813_17525 [Sphingomonas sp. RHCKR7]|uniref:hypothetical protein n=1 Tax=Sphingomonas folli TaxID=2862497 RepID=UPI001CA55BB4|nr:hypothetical protein [Sphingomonas folli]MBW6528645.1 hypothetical protein [Sphingomonas folli]